jgi:hypothetical protein
MIGAPLVVDCQACTRRSRLTSGPARSSDLNGLNLRYIAYWWVAEELRGEVDWEVG